jgi:hypothetical protein
MAKRKNEKFRKKTKSFEKKRKVSKKNEMHRKKTKKSEKKRIPLHVENYYCIQYRRFKTLFYERSRNFGHLYVLK